MDYLYDGTFNGLLNCIYHHYYTQKATGIFLEETYQWSLMAPARIIQTDEIIAKKVYDNIILKISDEVLNQIYNVYLSNKEKKEMLILEYIVKGLKVGKDIVNWLADPTVFEIMKTAKRVGRETHLFLGTIRFIEVSDYLYACIEPENHILPKISEHFADRLINERFIIHDKGRNLALAGMKGQVLITDFKLDKEIGLSDREKEFQRLWKNYFTTIGIESRINHKLQRQFVPLKYRKNITEFMDSSK